MPGFDLPSKLEQLTDEDLVVEYYTGDETAFDEIESRYHQRLWAYFRKRSFDDHICDDLVQETTIKIILGSEGRGPQYRRDGGRFEAWLFTIAALVQESPSVPR